MAAGDFTLFEEWLVPDGEKLINYETDTFKLGFIDAVVTPAADDGTPSWSVGSAKDYDGNEVSTAGGYTAGGETLGAVTWDEVGGVGTFDGVDISLAQNGSGFTDARWGILYSDTSTNKDAIGFVDFGAAISEQAGPITIAWHTNGIFTKTIV